MVSLALPLLVAATTALPQNRTFWKPVMGAELQPTQVQVTAELVGTGEHLAVYRETGYTFSLLGPEDEARQIAAAIKTFDEQIFPEQDRLFGPCPDRDDNGKVVLLLSRVNGNGGLFWRFDEMEESAALRFGFHSNEGEILYHGFADQGNRAVRNLRGLAQTFHQLLHFARDPLETEWSELLGNYAPYLCKLAPASVLWGEGDPATPPSSLSDPWGPQGWSPLFVHYLRERFGDVALSELVGRPEQGFVEASAMLARHGEKRGAFELLADFAMACWLDDPLVREGQYAFTSVTPPRPQAAVQARASRPAAGQVSVGVGGIAYLLAEGDGGRPLPLTLQGDAHLRWIGRAVHLRRHGPDTDLPIVFSSEGVARIELPALPNGDAILVAAVPEPADAAVSDPRLVALQWGLGWVPRPPVDRAREMFVKLLTKALPDAGVAARTRLATTVARLTGDPRTGHHAATVVSRYAWAPEAQDVPEVLKDEAALRGLKAQIQTFIREAPGGIRQDWQNVLIEVPGNDPRRWPVVLAAHWDGARTRLSDAYLRGLNLDDNASGVAVALEVAAAVSRMPHRAPVLVALLAGGFHDAAGAHALLEQLQGRVSAWIELDGVGIPDRAPNELLVHVLSDRSEHQLLREIGKALRQAGLSTRIEPGSGSTHAGAGVASARGIPAVVVQTRDTATVLAGVNLPLPVERQQYSPEYMVLLAKSVAVAATQVAGVP